MKINFSFGMAVIGTLMENCRQAVRPRLTQNESGHTTDPVGTPVYGRGMYGFLVMSRHATRR